MSDIRYLPTAARVPRPWKNGGGLTWDIACYPEQSGFDDFDWRISMAEVATSGPFSVFSGVDRTMCILEGDGLGLTIGSGSPFLLRQDDKPFAFPADIATDARLLGGPVIDLNIMSRRGVFQHSVSKLEFNNGTKFQTCGSAIIIWRTGEGSVETASGLLIAKRYDAFQSMNATEWRILSSEKATAFLIEFSV